ncbi:AsmA-like C-terminal region-containing protein [Cerasicoccus maritimus]|uniref:AsmA-like C-terminal region-containing protein n=1 Tax=Cerasicoccus maritimus TaxID=490089 RepID=UPI0028529648|nr:AsmA-like C-terminal region-containing protein [Cerasicoccus maritimus]
MVNTFLVLSFCLFAALIIFVLRDSTTPVPPQVVKLLDEEAAKHGLEVKFDALELDLRGVISARDLEIFTTGNSDPIIEADLLQANLSIVNALLGDFEPSQVTLHNGRFYAPPVISPNGQREELINKLYVDLSRKGQNWKINTFIMEVLEARAQVSGSFFTPLPGVEESQPSDPPPDITGIYIDTCEEMFQLKALFERFEDCILTVEISNERNGPLLTSAKAFIDGYYDQETQVKYGAANLELKTSLGADGILRPKGPGHLSLSSLQWKDLVKTGFTEAHLRLSNGVKGISDLPTFAEFYSYNIEAWGMPFDGAFASIDMSQIESKGRVKGDVMVKSGRYWMAFKGHFHPKDESGHIKMRARWNPKFILQCSALPTDDIPENIEVGGRPYWQASVKLEPGMKPTNSQFAVTLANVRYEDIQLEAAHVEGSITETALDLYSVDLYAKDYQVSGNYYQDFKKGAYHFQAAGTVWPHLLNDIIDEDWWNELWESIQFKDKPPHAAIQMSGKFGVDGSQNRIYGKASLEDAHYQGYDVSQASARIWLTPQTLDLFDFHLKDPAGEAQINLHWQYLPNNEQEYISFQGQTHVPLVMGASFATEDAVPIAKMFPSKETPRLDLAGLVYCDHSEHPGDIYLKAHALFPSNFEFQDIRFDHGNFVVALTPKEIRIPQSDLGMAGGKATLQSIIERQPNDQLYVKSATINLTDNTLYKLYEALPFLRVARAKQDAMDKINQAKGGDKQRPFEERYAGLVNLKFHTHGQLPDIDQFIGMGNLSLSKANLGQLHLLGGLSSFLYSIGLHLGTLNFNAASTDFTLAQSNLYIPNGRITGSTGEISANGNFDIENENLDFRLTVHPFGNVQTPIVSQMLSVLSPLANTFEVELKGTLTSPNYNISVAPLAIFTGQDKVEDKNADYIKSGNQSAVDAEKASQ